MSAVAKISITDMHLERLNELLRKVNEATEHAIQNLKEGQKISLKELTEKVAHFLDLSQTQCAPFVTMFVKQYDKCTMQKGRNGGIYKGKPVKKQDKTPRCMACGQKIKSKQMKSTKMNKSNDSGQQAA